ncbi:hypothetical protein Acr_00g0054970 [Actinidia rufa]|uniref:Uncharacterized protein n=1 Tax=Actinidia rufa TaxID=165716 RepID=A0A7J0DM01_9ERIC|nr:hypothetical protein Acr_00g0054970 [Actinidia rufa]
MGVVTLRMRRIGTTTRVERRSGPTKTHYGVTGTVFATATVTTVDDAAAGRDWAGWREAFCKEPQRGQRVGT